MKIIPHLAWAVVATATFALGYFATHPAAKNPIATQPIAVVPAAPARFESVDGRSGESALSGADLPGALTAEQARVRTFELLSLPGRV
ncbi:MAG: hypothetical protein M3463_03455 [Verrucomicrobiota bacterium]|nr:hypothetical protein [Verrucomicrobiota bacterium]